MYCVRGERTERCWLLLHSCYKKFTAKVCTNDFAIFALSFPSELLLVSFRSIFTLLSCRLRTGALETMLRERNSSTAVARVASIEIDVHLGRGNGSLR